MLVVSRKRNESLVINDDIVVTIIDIRGDRVRIGIEAPKEVAVCRREVFEYLRQFAADPDDPPSAPRQVGPPRPSEPAVSPRHLRLIDRLREAIRLQSGSDPSRQQILDAVLDGIEDCEEILREAESQEDLISLLRDKIDGKPGLFHWLS